MGIDAVTCNVISFVRCHAPWPVSPVTESGSVLFSFGGKASTTLTISIPRVNQMDIAEI